MLNLNMCEVLVVGRYLISKYVLLVIEDFFISFVWWMSWVCCLSRLEKKKKNWVARVIERGRASFNG
jgi:hypothetical protein